MTEKKIDVCACRPFVLELAGKWLARFTVPELRELQPNTVKDILATMSQRAAPTSSTASEVNSEDRKGDSSTSNAQTRHDEPTFISENLDQYFNAAIDNQSMTIEEYISLLKTALPMDRRDNHDGLIKAVCKLVKRSK